MSYLHDPEHPFYGIGKKLQRADESIINLQAEIAAFFEQCDYPVIPDPKDSEWQKAVDYHKALEIPVRFSVLTGEIIHHLRSSLDHVVWVFSSKEARKQHGSRLAFPIVWHNPPTPKDLNRFDEQIQGITDNTVRLRINVLQPYHKGADAVDDPLTIIHKMDIYDKHRELALISGGLTFSAPSDISDELAEALVRHDAGKPVSVRQKALIGDALIQFKNIRLEVLLAQFGSQKNKAVIKSLVKLINATVRVIEPFDRWS